MHARMFECQNLLYCEKSKGKKNMTNLMWLRFITVYIYLNLLKKLYLYTRHVIWLIVLFAKVLLEQRSSTNTHSFYVAFQLILLCKLIKVISYLVCTPSSTFLRIYSKATALYTLG